MEACEALPARQKHPGSPVANRFPDELRKNVKVRILGLERCVCPKGLKEGKIGSNLLACKESLSGSQNPFRHAARDRSLSEDHRTAGELGGRNHRQKP